MVFNDRVVLGVLNNKVFLRDLSDQRKIEDHIEDPASLYPKEGSITEELNGDP